MEYTHHPHTHPKMKKKKLVELVIMLLCLTQATIYRGTKHPAERILSGKVKKERQNTLKIKTGQKSKSESSLKLHLSNLR